MKKVLVIVFVAIFCGFIIAVRFVYNTTNIEKSNLIVSENLLTDIKELRIAIDKFHNLTGVYPNIVNEEYTNNLELIVAKDKKDNLVKFSDIYGKNKLAYTPETRELKKTNRVIDTNNFKETDLLGGWCYDYSGNTGEIHINLPKNALNQGVNWIKY